MRKCKGHELEELVTAWYGASHGRPDRDERPLPRIYRLDPAVDRVSQRHLQRRQFDLQRHRSRVTEGYMPASPGGRWPWPSRALLLLIGTGLPYVRPLV